MPETKMVLPFMLGRSEGRPATTTEDIDTPDGVRQENVNKVVKSSVVNVTAVYSLGPSTFAQVLAAVNANPKYGVIAPGIVLTFLTNEGWKSKQWKGTTWSNEEDWTDFGGSQVGNVFNVTNDIPIQGYYVLCDTENTAHSAVHAVWSARKAVGGLIISFEIRAGVWKTYQYIGRSTSEQNWKNTANWKDFGSLAEGSEICLNINNLCGSPTTGDYYTLQTAVARLIAWQESSGVNYKKTGLIISYQTAENTLETKQFQGSVTDFGEVGLWKDFGGGGEVTDQPAESSNTPFSAGGAYTNIPTGIKVDAESSEGVVKIQLENAAGDGIGDEKQFPVGTGGGGGGGEVTDQPAESSNTPFSAGGAYTNIPTGIKVDAESSEGVVKIQLENAAGDGIGDEKQFPVGTGGGGGGGGTVVAAAFQNSPLYGNAGGSFILRAAVRSVTTVGSTEQDNTIATIDLYDRDTNTLLQTFNFNRASSASMSTYDFVMDVTKYFATPGLRRFKAVITDDAGNTGSRNVNVTAVDVTISSVQTLQYTQSTALSVGGPSKSIPLFKFANNASDRGIQAITEIYLNGEWQQLGNSLITDTYSHSISIDPTDCLGSALSHGAYPIRVHGVDVASGVVGNYLYSGIFVIDSTNTTPIVVMSWLCETENVSVKLYESVEVNYAVYDPTSNAAVAEIYLNDNLVQTHTAYRSTAYTYTHQVSNVASDGSVYETVKVKCRSVFGVTFVYNVNGTVIDAAIKAGAIYAFDFANRSNEEADHSIISNGYEIRVNGANYSTTGFVRFNGEMALRIAENVTARKNHQPYKPTSIENNGMAIQFAFASKNCVDDDAILMSCFNEGVGAGFYVTGKAVAIYCATGLSNHVEKRFYRQGEKVTVAVVVEPAVEGLGQTRSGVTYYFIKLYLNGEEVACIGYVAGQSNLNQEEYVTWNGTQGEFYLFYDMAWDDYFLFDQAFQNYLVKLTNTEDMVREYNFENVMASQQVTELGITTTKLRPQASALAAQGMPYIVECPFNGSDIEALDNTVSTKTNNYVTLYYVDPNRPWTNFIAIDVRRRNQGTTSAQRPVKNPRYYLAKKNGSTYVKATGEGGTTVRLLYTREEIVQMGYDGALWDKANALAAINKIQIHEDSIPVDIITVKVDYSDSSNANDCGICDQMNSTFRALGRNYMTPAQRAYDGTWKKGSVELEGLVMNHSTANIPIAMFRSKDSNGTSPYFHAKGNWKEDKKEQVALGFNDVPGYNKGCLNYGDFVEFFGTDGETLAQTKARFLATSGLDTTKTYLLSMYCGSSYKFMKHNGTQWVEQTGSMVQNANGRWTVTGSVLNPVEGFELLNYQGMDWFKGVSSVADLMAPSTSFSKWVQALIDDGEISVQTVPAWTYYFETLIDDDDLAINYALGKKVPYNLYRWMKFCDSCDWDSYHSTDGDGGAARLNLWKTDLYKYASPHSCLSYDIATDYDAAVDQRAKNMQPMWFLEDGCKVVNGVYYNADNEESDTTNGMLAMRMYLNKVYDCDTCNGKDNDGGQTVDAEVDPNKMPDPQTGYTNPYAGYNSILFRNIYLQQTVNVDAGGTELSLKTVASAMRSCTTTVDGQTLKPFSPEGAYYFFVESRIKRWPKKVSSYDGERKYIDFTSTTANNIYFYALQGLGLTSLPAFIERRWRIRDGFYGTGDFFSGVLSGRVNAPSNAKIKIRAAKTGYFGIGNDSSGSLSESIYLEAGEEHEFTDFSHEEGALLYIYQADRMSMIDLSEITLSNNFDFSVMTLVEEIYLGKVGKVNLTIGAYTLLTNVNLGELPFLRKLDIRDTLITNVVCSSCPRMESLYAAGSLLTRADIADGAKITYMQLPATYTYLKLRYLPNLTLDGLVLASASDITSLIIEECDRIDGMELLRSLIAGNSHLRNVRVKTVKTSGTGTDLTTLMGMNLSGFDDVGNISEKPVIVGTYNLSRNYEDADIIAFNAAFEGLLVKNVQYTGICFHDTESDPENITNLDNNTGYGTGVAYAPSAHILKIWQNMHAVRAKKNLSTGKMEVRQLSDETYLQYADGSEFDPTDGGGEGYDVMMRLGHFWYKGVNDYKNQKKYTFFSSVPTTPDATGEYVRKTLAQLTKYADKGVGITGVSAGDTFTEESLSTISGLNSYVISVSGMKQIRFPGVNMSGYGLVFVNSNNKVVGTPFNMQNSNTLFDFYDGSGVITPDSVETDYFYIDIPVGAVKCYFCCFNSAYQSTEVIVTDSTEIEAIEPDWVEHIDNDLIGVYPIAIDGMNRPCSVSGAAPKRGNNTQTTWSGWTYDANGKVTNVVFPSGINYTCKDFMNLAEMRGEGYQLIDYEQNKIISQIFWAMTGNRNDQAVIGNGTGSYNTTGVTNSIGKANTNRANGVNKLLGLEGFIACWYEWMDNVAFNVKSWLDFKKARCVATNQDSVNYMFETYDPISNTGRKIRSTSGQSNIARVKHGRLCDTIPVKLDTTDNSRFVTYYCAQGYLVGSTGRVVGRAGYNANAYGGLAFAYTHGASSDSYTYSGSRLAFRGEIVEVAE